MTFANPEIDSTRAGQRCFASQFGPTDLKHLAEIFKVNKVFGEDNCGEEINKGQQDGHCYTMVPYTAEDYNLNVGNMAVQSIDGNKMMPTWRMTTTMATMHSNSVWNMEEQQCWTSWMQQLSNKSFTMSTGLASVWSPTRCRLRTTSVGQQHILTPWRRGFNKEYLNSAWLNWLPNTMSQQDLQLLCQQLDQLKVNKMKW